MKPYPFACENHFTMPVAMLLSWSTFGNDAGQTLHEATTRTFMNPQAVHGRKFSESAVS
jgi:hypothetical protein